MESYPTEARTFEFCFPHLDYTLVQVEDVAGEATIRATANTFSDERKTLFVRELAAEGFIADEYQWFSSAPTEPYSRGVRWLVDNSWLHLDEEQVARTQRFALRLLVPASVAWMLLIGMTYPRPNSRFAQAMDRPGVTLQIAEK